MKLSETLAEMRADIVEGTPITPEEMDSLIAEAVELERKAEVLDDIASQRPI